MDLGARKAVLFNETCLMMSPQEAEYHKNRTITIDSWVRTADVNAALRNLVRESDEEITIYISGHGGPVHSALSIFDTIRALGCPVCTVASGSVTEMGVFLLAAGTRGKRYIQEHAEIVFEPPLCASGREFLNPEASQKQVQAFRKKLYGILSECVDRSVDKIEEDMKKGCKMGAEAAIVYGIVDKIGDPISENKDPTSEKKLKPVRNLGILKSDPVRLPRNPFTADGEEDEYFEK